MRENYSPSDTLPPSPFSPMAEHPVFTFTQTPMDTGHILPKPPSPYPHHQMGPRVSTSQQASSLKHKTIAVSCRHPPPGISISDSDRCTQLDLKMTVTMGGAESIVFPHSPTSLLLIPLHGRGKVVMVIGPASLGLLQLGGIWPHFLTTLFREYGLLSTTCFQHRSCSTCSLVHAFCNMFLHRLSQLTSQ